VLPAPDSPTSFSTDSTVSADEDWFRLSWLSFSEAASGSEPHPAIMDTTMAAANNNAVAFLSFIIVSPLPY
jgi:hypothetical protein